MKTLKEFEDSNLGLSEYGAPSNTIAIRWLVRGASGGSCWDDSDLQEDEPEDEPTYEFEQRLLTAFNYITDQHLAQELVPSYLQEVYQYLHEITDEDHSDYYGNYSEHTIKYVAYSDVYSVVINYSRSGKIDRLLDI